MPSSFEVHVTLRADQPGGFQPTTFEHLIQQQMQLAGLDPRWTHTVLDAKVSKDGNAALLHLHCEAPHHHRLDQTLRIVNGTPPAKVRAVHAHTGDVLHEVTLHAPLAKGQHVQIGEDHFQVSHEEWPHRNEHGVCEGWVDWQHAHLVPIEADDGLPVAVNAEPEDTEPERTQQRRGEHDSVHERADVPEPSSRPFPSSATAPDAAPLVAPTPEAPAPAPVDDDPEPNPTPDQNPSSGDAQELPPPPDNPTPPAQDVPPGVFPPDPNNPDETEQPAEQSPEDSDEHAESKPKAKAKPRPEVSNRQPARSPRRRPGS